MGEYPIIDTAECSAKFYAITYIAAFAVAGLVLIRTGRKKGYPVNDWLLILLSGSIGFIIGNKMAGWTPEIWVQVFTRLYIPEALNKDLVGGVAGVVAGVWLTKIFLRFRRPILDDFAVVLPVCMAISRIGCIGQGCCFGAPSGLPWAIRYGETSQAFHAHLAHGWIGPGETASLAVHPAQLYQVIGCMVIALLVWKTRNRWKAAGSLFVFSVMCYAVFRFFLEFVRAPESNHSLGQILLGLKIIQWIALAGILCCFIVLRTKEQTASRSHSATPEAGSSGWRPTVAAMLITLAALAGRDWFDLLESFTIWLFLFPVLTLLALKYYRSRTVAGYRWTIPALLVCGFCFMAQSGGTVLKQNEQVTFNSIGLTGMIGSYYEDLGMAYVYYVGGSCGSEGHWEGRLYDAGKEKRPFYQAGFNYSHNIWIGKYRKKSVGFRAFYGDEPGSTAAIYPSGVSLGVSGYMRYDWQWAGFGYGLSLGQMKLPIGHRDVTKYNTGDIISIDYRNFYIFPSASLRVGPTDVVYAEASVPALFPSASPVFGVQAGVGSGLGRTDGTMVGIGFCQGIYAKAAYPVAGKFLLEAFYGDNLGTGNGTQRVFAFTASYRFGAVKTTIDTAQIRKDKGIAFHRHNSRVKDADKNNYQVVYIQDQLWLMADLKTNHFRDGSEIPGVTKNKSGNGNLYPWVAVSDPRGLCPAGWHVPAMDEWKAMRALLGDEKTATKRLASGLDAKKKMSRWWSSTGHDSLTAGCVFFDNENAGILFVTSAKSEGLSVRCVCDQLRKR